MKIKTKIVTILMCVFSVAAALAFGGCDWSTTHTPTEKSAINWAKEFDVSLPEDVTLVNYAITAEWGEGVWFYVLEYNGNDENFINRLSGEDDDKDNVAGKFQTWCKDLKNEFNEPYEIPSLSAGYYWLYEWCSNAGTDFIGDTFYILYIPSANQILVRILII